MIFNINESDAYFEVRDPNGNIIEPNNDGVYELKNGIYTYFVYKEGFDVKEDSFIVADKSLEIDIELKPLNTEYAYLEATGREGDHEIDGVTYTFIEFEMLDENGERISLAEDNVEYIRSNGRKLTPNTDHTLWFNKDKESGRYVYVVKTKDGIIYQAVLEWIKP